MKVLAWTRSQCSNFNEFAFTHNHSVSVGRIFSRSCPRFLALLNRNSECDFGWASHLSCTRSWFTPFVLNVAQMSVPGGHHWGFRISTSKPRRCRWGRPPRGYYPIFKLRSLHLRVVTTGADASEPCAALKVCKNQQMREFVIRMRANFSLGVSCLGQMLYA